MGCLYVCLSIICLSIICLSLCIICLTVCLSLSLWQVAETCQLAVCRLEWLQSGGENRPEDSSTDRNPYCSVDPAPPSTRKSISELQTLLLDESLPLFERYRAMFALRNLGNEEAVLALGEGGMHNVAFCFAFAVIGHQATHFELQVIVMFSLNSFYAPVKGLAACLHP